jgi:4-aminobutyrate aminotransferase-like enzyme
MTFGTLPPLLRTPVPGPRSRELARRLRRVESRNITRVWEGGPIFWARAVGANVRDVDGNVFVDLTGGFGVAAAGHANAHVSAAVSRQFARLPHALGDVHPSEAKVELLERLAALAPGALSVGILASDGADAVEAALKTALLATGRPGVVAFEGGYHGLTYGALGVTGIPRFRDPFQRQLYTGVRFAPYPSGPGLAGEPAATSTAAALDAVRQHVLSAGEGEHPVGAVLAEPVLGRGGIVVPPGDFLPGLRSLCDELDLVLILDEIFTGFGRTGRWFACQHSNVVPDLLVVGKALAGGLPLSAVLGAPETMEAWPDSTGDALHTSTFLGNPVACAAAVAHLRQIEGRDLVQRAGAMGHHLASRLDEWIQDGRAVSRRGLGLMQAVVPAGREPGLRAIAAAEAVLADGVLVLPETDALVFTPPLVINEAQLDAALQRLAAALDRV